MLKCLNAQKGVSVYLAIIIMFILLGIGLALSTILVGQIIIMREMGHSVVALYAADTGIERTLYAIRKEEGYTPVEGQQLCGTRFDINTCCLDIDGNGSCTNKDANYDIKIKSVSDSSVTLYSKGIYQKTYRAIEINY